ncbi:hypothetical protein [Alistipes sp. ZOR0009]|uniref:hypothetical protein n=1 Tax=Alistipes sp. ZOR0009 TaxID=1339253 RepID=UPI000647144B|nr:hypothetical protein [Alistipes sp. ZOR0009]
MKGVLLWLPECLSAMKGVLLGLQECSTTMKGVLLGLPECFTTMKGALLLPQGASLGGKGSFFARFDGFAGLLDA